MRAYILYLAQDLAHGNAEQVQQVRGYHEARFHGLGYHFRGARLHELVQIHVIAGAHQHRHIRAEFFYVPEDLECRRHLEVADDHRACPFHTRGFQYRRVGAVAVIHRVTGLAGAFHPYRVEIQRHERETFRFQEARHILADATVSDDEYVVLRVDLVLADVVLQPVALIGIGVREDARRDGVVGADQQRAHDHAEHDHGETELGKRRTHDAGGEAESEQRETEFTALGEYQPGAQCRTAVGAEHAAQQRHQRGLEEDECRHRENQQPPVARHDVRVEQHADSDEEQPQQDVTEWTDICIHLVTVLGLRQHHAGKEGAEGQRQAQRRRAPGGRQRHQQHRDRE